MDQNKRIEQLEEDLRLARERIRHLENTNFATDINAISSLSNNLPDLKESVIDNLHHPIVILDENLQVVFANKIFFKTFETTSEVVYNKFIYSLDISQWNTPQLKNVLETILPSKCKMSNFEIDLENHISEKSHLLLNASEIRLSGTDDCYILLSIEDITTRKHAQNSLRKSQQQFHDLFYTASAQMAIFEGPEHVIEMANESFIKTIGKGDDILGKPISEVVPEAVEQGIVDLLDSVYHTGVAFHAVELPVELVRNGVREIRYFDVTYQPQRNELGDIIGVVDISTDVTNQALLNETIKKNESQFRGLVNLIPNKINLASDDGNSFYYNRNWLDYTGLTSNKLVENGWLSLVPPEEYLRIDKQLSQFKESGEEFEFEARLLNKEKEYKWHLIKSVPVKGNNDSISSWITSCTEIQNMKDEEVHKEGFLKLVSHELKTPVTSIKGYIQLLQSILPEEVETDSKNIPVKPYLHRIESQIERLIRLISEMLDLSRIEQNELILEYSDFQLNEQIETVVQDLSFSHREMQIDINHNEQISINADKERIGQVISNLITNAVKYSPDTKKVSVRIFKTEDNQAAVSVKDYGIGIALQEQQQIFKRFYRVSGNKDDTYEGFGIGLYLSNEIIEKHQGKILVKSEPGEGSEFTFLLPLN